MDKICVENLVATEKAVPKRHIVRSDAALYVLLLAAVIGIIVAGNALSDRFMLPRLYVQLSMYAVLLVIGWLVYRYCLISFRYTLTERMLRVERIVGRKERSEENVHLSDIVWIRPFAACTGTVPKQRAIYVGSKQRSLAVGVTVNRKDYTLLFSPSEEFMEKLIQQWKTVRK